MAEVTVKQLAETTGVAIEKLLQQMHQAGLPQNDEADVVSDEDKQGLLAFLKGEQNAPSASVSPKKITLKRRAQSTLKIGRGGHSVKVETRRKRTYVKRVAAESSEDDQSGESDSNVSNDPSQLQIEAERIRLEEERRQTAEQEGRAEAIRKKEDVELREKEELLAVSESDNREAQAKDEAKVKAETKAKAKAKEDKTEADAVAQAAATAQAQAQAAEKGNRRGKGQSRDRDRSGPPDGKRTRRRELSLKKESRRMKQRVALQQDKQGGEFSKPVEEIQREVEIGELVSVGDLAQRMSIKTGEVIKTLMGMGVMATINQTIDQDTAVLVVEEMGHKAKIVADNQIEQELEESLKVEGDLVSRSVVVTVMGHVDHGKTSLLDHIRKSRVVAGEAGGITQHIGAYHVETPHGNISFIDTPGHAAFTAMRARGAMATDVVILVCAADDGVMPQTEEAVQHAKAAEVPMVVAVNKMDLEGADPERVRNELAAIDVIPEDWGGDTQFVNVSAETGEGIDALLEAVNLQAEILELKAVPEAPGRGVVIESKLERGPVATVLVQNGTLKQGDVIIAGETFGKVRALVNEHGQTVASAGPSIPVEVLGLNGTPNAGDDFSVAVDDRRARDLAEFRAHRSQEQRQASQQAAKLENMFANLGKGEKRVLKLVLKTDVRGSLEAITQSFAEIGNEEVSVNVLGSGVGGISESDATMAMTYGAVIFGFNVRADNSAKDLIDKEAIELRYYSVIYELLDDVRTILEGMLAPEIREEIVGTAEVRDVFQSPRYGQVAGCMVVEGTVFRNKSIRVLRENVVIYEGELESLRRFKDDVGEVRNGLECGIGVRNYNDVQSGDKIEVFETTEVARAL